MKESAPFFMRGGSVPPAPPAAQRERGPGAIQSLDGPRAPFLWNQYTP